MGKERCSNGYRCILHFNRLKLFYSVVPKVEEFNKKFVENGRIKILKNLLKLTLMS
ncbi:MAG: hypothetical protein QXY40_02220 [Candidatus Methanomethylicia archaeon]